MKTSLFVCVRARACAHTHMCTYTGTDAYKDIFQKKKKENIFKGDFILKARNAKMSWFSISLCVYIHKGCVLMCDFAYLSPEKQAHLKCLQVATQNVKHLKVVITFEYFGSMHIHLYN